ncbi:MAG: HAD family hydrolase [Bryobacteraceae bacterium]
MPDVSSPRLAFYDLDGTLVSSNIVTQYAFLARQLPSRAKAAMRYTKVLASVPLLVGLDFCSRRLFNEFFFREYKGMQQEWLRERSDALFEKLIRPTIYAGSPGLVAADRREGYKTVLVTGTLDFVLHPVVRFFGFDHVICNSLIYENGCATGCVAEPLIAGKAKVAAMMALMREHGADPSQAKAYSDSFSDLPMLEAVSHPAAVNPDRRLRRLARERGWPVLNLRENHVN